MVGLEVLEETWTVIDDETERIMLSRNNVQCRLRGTPPIDFTAVILTEANNVQGNLSLGDLTRPSRNCQGDDSVRTTGKLPVRQSWVHRKGKRSGAV